MAAGLVTPLRPSTESTVHRKTRYLLISGVNQGYHQINWDCPGYLWLVTCGPERVVLAQLLLGVHICLIFIQCLEKTSLQWPSIASATDMELADPFAGLGKCDSRVVRSLKPFFSCFSNHCRNLLMACSISSGDSGLVSMVSSWFR